MAASVPINLAFLLSFFLHAGIQGNPSYSSLELYLMNLNTPKKRKRCRQKISFFPSFFPFLIYRELLDDENFQESLIVIKNEPILYFNQFASQHQSTTKQVYETSIGSQRSTDHKRVWDTEQGPVDRSSALPESESQVLGERESQALGAVDTESC